MLRLRSRRSRCDLRASAPVVVKLNVNYVRGYSKRREFGYCAVPVCEIYSQRGSSICVTHKKLSCAGRWRSLQNRTDQEPTPAAIIMADAAAADEEPDAHELLLHAVSSLKHSCACIQQLTVR
jgi:hypothetical protein